MDAGAWIAAASAALALVALYFTYQQVQTAKKQTELQDEMRRDAAQPYVWADLLQSAEHGHLLQLVVHNEGPTTAENVVVTFDPPVEGMIGSGAPQPVRLTSLTPGRRMSWHVAMAPEWFAAKKPSRFQVDVTYLGPFGVSTQRRYEVDVDAMKQVNATAPGTLHGIREELKNLVKAIQKN